MNTSSFTTDDRYQIVITDWAGELVNNVPLIGWLTTTDTPLQPVALIGGPITRDDYATHVAADHTWEVVER